MVSLHVLPSEALYQSPTKRQIPRTRGVKRQVSETSVDVLVRKACEANTVDQKLAQAHVPRACGMLGPISFYCVQNFSRTYPDHRRTTRVAVERRCESRVE